MQSLVITESPEVSDGLLDDLTLYLRVNSDAEESLIESWLLAAFAKFEIATGYTLSTTAYRLSLDNWPCVSYDIHYPFPNSRSVIYLPRRPVTAVQSVEYLDTDGEWQELDDDDYSTDLDSTPARITLPSSLPSLHSDQRPRVRVAFTAGHDPDYAPDLPLNGCRLLVGAWYAHREAHSEINLNITPFGWDSIVAMYWDGVTSNWNR